MQDQGCKKSWKDTGQPLILTPSPWTCMQDNSQSIKVYKYKKVEECWYRQLPADKDTILLGNYEFKFYDSFSNTEQILVKFGPQWLYYILEGFEIFSKQNYLKSEQILGVRKRSVKYGKKKKKWTIDLSRIRISFWIREVKGGGTVSVFWLMITLIKSSR